MPATPATQPTMRFGLRRQLIAAMGFLAALLIAVSTTALLSVWNLNEKASQTFEVEGELNRLANNIAFLSQQCRLNERELFLSFDRPMVRDSYIIEWQASAANLDTAIRAFRRVAIAPEDRQQAEQWSRQLSVYHTAFDALQQSIKNGDIPTADVAVNTFMVSKADILPLMNTAQTMAQAKERRAQRAEVELLNDAVRSTWLVLAMSGLACVAAVTWCLYFPTRLMRPIAELQMATSRLAEGDLAARAALQRTDELGLLSRRFDTMAGVIQQRTADLETQHAQATAARIEAEAARAEITDQLATIAKQHEVIREMSVPVLPLTQAVLVLPLVGALDSMRLRLVQEQALQSIEQSGAHYLILDITGVPVVDTAVAQGLISIVQAARLLGAEVMLVGIRPEVAQAVVGLGINLGDIATHSTLQSGVAYVLWRSERTFLGT